MFRKLAPALVAPLLIVSACASESDGASVDVRTGEEAITALRSAPAAAAEAGTASFETTMEVSLEGETFEVVGTGAYDADNQRMTMEMDLGSALGGLGAAGEGAPDEPMQMVVDGSTVYLRAPLFELLGGEDTWLSLSAEDLGGTASDLGLGSGSYDPSKILDSLRGVTGEPEAVGTESVRGVETTRYTADLDLAEAVDAAPEDQREMIEAQLDQLGETSISVDVWVDDDGLVRRMQLDMGGMLGGTATLTIELFDYGQPVDIEVPSPDDVRSLTDGLGIFGDGLAQAS